MPSSSARSRVYLRRIQGAHGGWPLFHDGAFDISASVKAYFALKMIGDDPTRRTWSARARRSSRAAARRGATCSRASCSRCSASVPWSAVPVMPVEIMLLPRWFPFHLTKVSYWARTVIVPLLVLQALKPRAQQSRRASASTSCSCEPPRRDRAGRKAPHQKWPWFCCSSRRRRGPARRRAAVSRATARKRAIEHAVEFVTERLNGEDGLGAIFPGDGQRGDDVRRARLSA